MRLSQRIPSRPRGARSSNCHQLEQLVAGPNGTDLLPGERYTSPNIKQPLFKITKRSSRRPNVHHRYVLSARVWPRLYSGLFQVHISEFARSNPRNFNTTHRLRTDPDAASTIASGYCILNTNCIRFDRITMSSCKRTNNLALWSHAATRRRLGLATPRSGDGAELDHDCVFLGHGNTSTAVPRAPTSTASYMGKPQALPAGIHSLQPGSTILVAPPVPTFNSGPNIAPQAPQAASVFAAPAPRQSINATFSWPSDPSTAAQTSPPAATPVASVDQPMIAAPPSAAPPTPNPAPSSTNAAKRRQRYKRTEALRAAALRTLQDRVDVLYQRHAVPPAASAAQPDIARSASPAPQGPAFPAGPPQPSEDAATTSAASALIRLAARAGGPLPTALLPRRPRSTSPARAPRFLTDRRASRRDDRSAHRYPPLDCEILPSHRRESRLDLPRQLPARSRSRSPPRRRDSPPRRSADTSARHHRTNPSSTAATPRSLIEGSTPSRWRPHTPSTASRNSPRRHRPPQCPTTAPVPELQNAPSPPARPSAPPPAPAAPPRASASSSPPTTGPLLRRSSRRSPATLPTTASCTTGS